MKPRHSRRLFLMALGTTQFAGCHKPKLPTATDHKIAPVEISPEEFKLLEDPSAQKATIESPLLIKSRLLGPPHRLDGIELSNIQFIDCDFLGHFMFNVSLRNVAFTRCAIVGVRWEDGRWDNVSFVDCVGQGKANNIVPGSGTGKTIFRGCKFSGDAPPAGGDFDSLEYQGGVGTAGETFFDKCDFERINIRVIGKAHFTDCHFSSAGMQASRSEVPIEAVNMERCDGKYTVDLSTPGINSLSVKDSTFNRFVLNHCKSKNISFQRFKGNLDLSVVTADSLEATNCIFRASMDVDHQSVGGLATPLSRFGKIVLDTCQFERPNARWDSKGDAPLRDGQGKITPRFTVEHDPLPYLNEWSELNIKKTSVAGADFSYSNIGRMQLNECIFMDNTVTHCEIGDMIMSRVTLGGRLDFSDTRVAKLEASDVNKDGLTVLKDKLTKFELSASSGTNSAAIHKLLS